MNMVLIRMIAAEAPRPEVLFVGTRDKAESMLFRVMYNAEGGYGKVEDKEGIHITVKENHMEGWGKKTTPVIKEVHYFLQLAKTEYDPAALEN